MGIKVSKYRNILIKAIEEDVGAGDVSTASSIDPKLQAKAYIVSQEDMVVCGMMIAKEIFKLVDRRIKCTIKYSDGSFVNKKKVLAVISGPARGILTAERTVLNFLAHLSGIASITRRFVRKIKRYKVTLLDTRKTTPLLRDLQKYAVVVGGGVNHRRGLWDGIMLKENHLLISGIRKKNTVNCSSLINLINNLKKATNKKVEVEVESKEEFEQVIRCKPDIILLDNFKPELIKECVLIRNKIYPRVKLEASGGINIDNLERFAKTGVDFISVGSLTHSFKSSDISLDVFTG